MLKKLKRAHDRFFGVGEADTSVPVFDGALKPNNVLESAAVFLEREGLEDMAVMHDGQLAVAAGQHVLQVSASGAVQELAQLPAPVQALAAYQGGLAVATRDGLSFLGGQHDGKQVSTLNGRQAGCINALHAGPDGSLLISQGSRANAYADWAADLLTRGKSGSVLQYVPQTDQCTVRAQGLAYCYGVCAQGETILASESWAHRLLVLQGTKAQLGPSEIPGYPSRMSPARGGGFWLTIFAPRTQLLEFVLREDAYRDEMMRTIEPRYWIAPALSSGDDFMEPLQQGSVRQMGILKPWAPPRSYGLVVRLSADLTPLYSVHSRVGGRHHGVTAALEFDGALLALSKGSGRILRIPLSDLDTQG